MRQARCDKSDFARPERSDPNGPSNRVLRALQSVGLGYLTLGQPATTLSGGEAQRILIAITLASQPKYVLFDESTSALDKASKMAVEDSVKAFVQQGRGGVLWISHDEEQAERMAIV